MNICWRTVARIVVIIGLPAHFAVAGEAAAARKEAMLALQKAVGFFHSEVSSSGYVWRYSGDLTLREGEGKASETMIWVQPPGTSTVGEAFLDAYEATGEKAFLDAAVDASYAVIKGQLRTGGWYYHIEFDPEKRRGYGYRDIPERPHQKQKTTLDDDTTQSAVRLLMRVDEILNFEDEKVHEAVVYALDSIVRAQYPNGAWYMWWDSYPEPARPDEYAAMKASYPQTWPRKWPNDWTGCYFINDNITPNTLLTVLDAYQTYGREKYLCSALKAGDFLLLAQMPEPQPAWAQQYDRNMHPVWDRKFEPPAITSLESQGVMRALMLLYQKTGKKKYLTAVPRVISYLRKSQLPDGRLARFYELRTNRPLYFTKQYELTYSDEDMPTHYTFVTKSWLDSIEAEYHLLLRTAPSNPNLQMQGGVETQRLSPALVAQVRTIIDSMDERGAWVERGQLRWHKIEPKSGIIDCRTFVNNIRTLCQFLTSDK